MNDRKPSWREEIGLSSDGAREELGAVEPPKKVGYGFSMATPELSREAARLRDVVEILRAQPSFIQELDLARIIAAHVPGIRLDYARHDPRFVVVGGAEPSLVVGEAMYAEDFGGLLRLSPDALGALVYVAEGAQIWIVADHGVLRAERIATRSEVMEADESAESPAVKSGHGVLPRASEVVDVTWIAPWLLERVRHFEAFQGPYEAIAALGHVARFAMATARARGSALEPLVYGQAPSPAAQVAEIARSLSEGLRERAYEIALDRADRILDDLDVLEELVLEGDEHARFAAESIRLERNALDSVALVLRAAGDKRLDEVLEALDDRAWARIGIMDAAGPAESEELAQAAIESREIWWGPNLQ